MNLGGTVRLNKYGIFVVIALVILLFYYMNRNNNYKSRKVNLRHLVFVSIEVAERGGREIVKIKNEHKVKETSKGKTKEGANVPVTTADLKSHCAMVYPITDLFPDIKVISEERDQGDCDQKLPIEIGSVGLPNLDDVEVSSSDIDVWIDPLDATQEFTEDLLEYVTTMVCIAHKGVPIIGVIHQPFVKPMKTIWAWKNHGHSKIPTPSPKQEDGEIVIISRSHAGEAENLIKKAFGEDVKIIKAGGSGYKVLQLIEGNATVYTHVTDIHKWDICAGDAILTALAGRFSTLDDGEIDYNSYSTHTNTRGVLATMSANQDKHAGFATAMKEAAKKY